jgi:hypothetical protein
MTSFPRLAAIAAIASLSAAPASAADKRFGLTVFDTIEVSADIAVEVVTRAPVSAVASGPSDALDRLVLENRDGRLVISERKYAGDERRNAPRGAVTLRINAANLQTATLVGAGSLKIDRLKGQRVAIGLRGPGSLTVGDVAADRLAVAMVGNGTMTLAGKAKQGQMSLSGASMLDAGKLAIDELSIDSEGAGDHLLNAVKSANVTARGIGKTIVLGRPVCTVRNIGSGSVTCGPAKR